MPPRPCTFQSDVTRPAQSGIFCQNAELSSVGFVFRFFAIAPFGGKLLDSPLTEVCRLSF